MRGRSPLESGGHLYSKSGANKLLQRIIIFNKPDILLYVFPYISFASELIFHIADELARRRTKPSSCFPRNSLENLDMTCLLAATPMAFAAPGSMSLLIASAQVSTHQMMICGLSSPEASPKHS
jgi:hypothetical protein